jgi:scyllo-inositol 2-dehydrogenase (NADP+)
MNNGIIRVGIAGYGLAGSVFHAPLIRAHRQMEIAAIFTSRDIPARVQSLDALIECSDLIVVASPNTTHFEIASKALDAGRHVVVDKPFALSVEQADTLIALASSKKRVLSAFHNRRWDCDFLTVRELLPRLGDVMLFEASWDRFRPQIKQSWREVPEPGSGLLSDLGPHLVDQALQLFGMPNFIDADIIAQRRDAQVDDYFDLTLHYGSARVSLRSSTLVAAPRPRFALHGSSGSFVKYGLDPQEAQLKSGLGPGSKGFGIDPVEGTLTDAQGRSEKVTNRPGNYFAFYEAIAEAILTGAPVPVTAHDARDGLLLIDLARRASEQGRRLAISGSSSTEG